MTERSDSAVETKRAKRKFGAPSSKQKGVIDTLTLTAEEHGVESEARKIAAQIEARAARRDAEAARRYFRERAAVQADYAPFGLDLAQAPGRGAPGDTEATYLEPRGASGHMSREDEAVARLRRIADGLHHGHAPRSARRGDISYMTGSAGHQKIDWAHAEAPSREDVEAIAAAAYAALPKTFRDLCDGVAILVRDFAEDDVLDALGIENEFDLMGLYEGVELTLASGDDISKDLNRIFLYRRPILDYWLEHHDTLGAVITHVLVHEIGHHFGLSDADMEAIERSAG